MELSTSIPIPNNRPAMEIIFTVIPFRYIHKRVMSTDKGIESPTIKVDFKLRRKMNSTAMARRAP